MAKVSYSGQSIADLERIADFLSIKGEAQALECVFAINDAIDVLSHHPLLGRSAEAGLRELIIRHGRSGYIALYSYDSSGDAVLILAVRHQREAGFRVSPV